MSGEPTVIYSAANAQQAYLLKGLLEERGIAAWVVNDAIQIAGGELPLGWTAAAKVVVGLQDAADARQLAEEFDHRIANEPTGEESDSTDTADDTADWAEWPVCPACGERRSARCPVCSISGCDFPLADIQESAEGQRVFLHCAACDDHFLPDWYRLCARCGHDYGDGIEVESLRQPLEFNLRTTLTIAALVAAAVAFLAYFVWLFAGRTA